LHITHRAQIQLITQPEEGLAAGQTLAHSPRTLHMLHQLVSL